MGCQRLELRPSDRKPSLLTIAHNSSPRVRTADGDVLVSSPDVKCSEGCSNGLKGRGEGTQKIGLASSVLARALSVNFLGWNTTALLSAICSVFV